MICSIPFATIYSMVFGLGRFAVRVVKSRHLHWNYQTISLITYFHSCQWILHWKFFVCNFFDKEWPRVFVFNRIDECGQKVFGAVGLFLFIILCVFICPYFKLWPLFIMNRISDWIGNVYRMAKSAFACFCFCVVVCVRVFHLFVRPSISQE